MSDVRASMSDYSDERLLTEFSRHKDEYTAEALDIMRQEIERRGLKEGRPPAEGPATASTEAIHLNTQDFVQFDHSFLRTDLMLASAILREAEIPFFVDNPTSTDTIPIESESEKLYTIRIHASFSEKAHALLDEHFIKADNRYLLKYTGAKERLKVFNFSDIHLSEAEAAEEMEVSFTSEEKRGVISLGRRLLGEAEAIEKAQERVLFYFDSIEELLAHLEEPGRTTLSRSDLLAMLEILQVYVGDPSFPSSMEEAISQLLSFFLET